MIVGATLGMLALTKWSISSSEEHHQSWVQNNYALSMR